MKKYLRAAASLLILLFLYLFVNTFTAQGKLWNDNVTADITGPDKTTQHYPSPDFRMVNKHDTVVLHVALPKDQEIQDATLCFYVYHAVVNVRYGSELLYSYGSDLAESGTMIGAQYPQIRIPDDAWGNEITIQMDVKENKAFSRITSLRMYPADNAWQFFLNDNAANCILILAGLVFSVLGLLLLLIIWTKDSWSRQLACILILMLTVFIWLYSETGMFRLFSSSHIWSEMEFISLFFAIIPLLLYMRENEPNPRIRKACSGIALYCTVFFIVTTILNFTNIMHYCDTLFLCHINILASCIVMLYVSHRRVKKEKGDRLLLLGCLVMVLFAVLDVCRFNIIKFVPKLNGLRTASIIPVGMIVFVIMLFASFYTALTRRTVIEQTNARLRQLAYIDPLTGLGNRARCDEVIRTIHTSPLQGYIIIMLDLNNLKAVNDRFGHDTGDRLLQHFGTLLHEIFADTGDVIRNGGDEFLVIAHWEYRDLINDRLSLMQERMKTCFSDIDPPVGTITAAYGTAESSPEKPILPEKAIKTADQAMYNMKVRQKVSRR